MNSIELYKTLRNARDLQREQMRKKKKPNATKELVSFMIS
jgi:hypothetical protein